ncbi:MAG: LysM peptidoglycan-binding domain-containing protein [Anaerolineales bacterium]|nr:LysM peptidoglycan-binding domain-containing protein [Anaerolineales bacterium]
MPSAPHFFARPASLQAPIAQPLRLADLSHLAWLLALLLLLSLSLARGRAIPIPLPRLPWEAPVWGTKPLLGYFALTASLQEPLRDGAKLSERQFFKVQQIATQEIEQLRLLELQSRPIIQDSSLTLEQKRQRIVEMGYNQQVMRIVRDSNTALEQALDARTYFRLVGWIERCWSVERQLHGSSAAAGARSYKIYATRYDSSGAYYAALPDQCVKFTNGGLKICEDKGYKVGKAYDVALTYKKSTVARVGEAGPWNVDDTYWASYADPTPRRMFADLPVGMPEAQAAYINGYNGGVDQYGRKVTAPYGIDLAKQVSKDIGLEVGVNDWITVTFLWTEGWGSGGSAATPKPGATLPPGATQVVNLPVQVSTPNPDGSVIHEVKTGETLWTIAAIYKINLQDLLDRNNLTKDSIIRPGDRLIIQPAGPTATATVDQAATQTAAAKQPTRTPEPDILPTDKTATAHTETLQTGEPSPPPDQASPQPAQMDQRHGLDPLAIASIFLLSAGILLLLLGKLLDRRD